MCHYCGVELPKSNEYKKKQDIETIRRLNDGEWSCKYCEEKQLKRSLKVESMENYSTPSISPTDSFSSTDSSVSSFSDLSVDVNSSGRGMQEVSSYSSQEESSLGRTGHVQNPNLQSPVEIDMSTDVYNHGYSFRNVETGRRGARDDNVDTLGFNEETETTHPLDNDSDSQIWDPPDAEDDMDFNDADDDEDEDEYGDGTKWGKPISLSKFGEGSGSFRFKEEKQRALEEVMNGEFKALVSQLLKSVGVPTSSKKDSNNWVDIVTSLSWEAALFVKPDAIKGKPMDADGYVKVKCIAAGSPNQSQVIKGLVFKKHAAHKHMPTMYKNPRLLLIRGVLGQSLSKLSSFASMEKERDNLKSIVEMIEMCHPNVVLVEKTVSRDIQESLLAKGMTLVFDMKLHRLERVARCTGSPILTCDTLMSQKLKQCDSFHFEKFVEEHSADGEGEKKPSKTLMFIEGCPTRLGCTILLKGSRSDELKRIKCVVQCAVVMAYHLILETSFLLDQRTMFSTIPFNGVSSKLLTDNNKSPLVEYCNSKVPCEEGSSVEITCDIPISGESEGNSESLSYEPYNPFILSGISSLSASLKKVIGNNFPRVSATSYQTMSKYFGFNSNDAEKSLNDVETKGISDEKSVGCAATVENKESGGNNNKEEEQVENKDEISTVLDSQSILVLVSSRNASRGTICEQSHFSHIMFYKNFDIPLGKFLRDNVLNQKLQCSTCAEPPGSHIYYYAHHSKQLTIQVKRISIEKWLPGESEGKLWMWSRCCKCKTGKKKSTKRVLISTAAHSLSFGKFLELSFSHHSSSNRLSSCGHTLHRDFLYFFGLGPMVAMFKYSPVTTYAVSVPPHKLEFNNSIQPDLLYIEIENVLVKGMSLFTEIANYLHKIRSRFTSAALNLRGSLTDFSGIEEMLRLERSDFEVNIRYAAKNEDFAQPIYRLLTLNRLLWELLLESYIWDQRLCSLLSHESTTTDNSVAAQSNLKKNGKLLGNEDHGFDINSDLNMKTKASSVNLIECGAKEISIEGPVEGLKEAEETESSTPLSLNPVFQEGNHSLPGKLQEDGTIPITIDHESGSESSDDNIQLLNLENSQGWFWTPFSEIRREYFKDLQRGYMPKFDCARESLPSIHKLIMNEGSRLHIPLDDYIVSDYEGELSSIIACALALFRDLPMFSEDLDEDSRKERRLAKTTMSSHAVTPIASMASNGSLDSDGSSTLDGSNLLDSLISLSALHPEISLEKFHGKGKYAVVCLYADRFNDLRKRCCPSELDYIASLSRCKNWDAKGGKSKSFFAKTLDDRFIIKEIKKTELDSFMKFAPDYFGYMKQSFESGNQTCLAKILGIYQVTIRQGKSGKEMKHDLMVMENVTFGRNITRQYDLKGALHARYTSAVDGSGDVLLDQNFVDDMNASPLYVSRKAKRILQRAVWNDTTFLNSINVMDYSLLVGVDTQRHELVCGIIDYLRQYTWDKQLETWVKSSLVVPKNVLPTVISPIEYKKRFRKFMTIHFLSVPDHWCSRRSSNPCKLCGTGSDGDDEINKNSTLQVKSPKQEGARNGFVDGTGNGTESK